MTTGKAPGFAEQSSPAALAIDDLNASVSNLHFDGNLTRRWSRRGSKKRLLAKIWTSWTWEEFLGSSERVAMVLSWDPPVELLRVDVYVAYFATGDLGQNRSQIGQDVPVGTDQVLIPAETPRGIFSHFVS
ncbi:unnamed protein product [Cladocopium goreaui]|uniref:Uncharacterized protein n=1 Tax=Cladocopium goreaui TaxID=2562237 RepID=A0A9P1FDT6_9DINO|nr:unnamed protein product [Cladocopium goreaui]